MDTQSLTKAIFTITQDVNQDGRNGYDSAHENLVLADAIQ